MKTNQLSYLQDVHIQQVTAKNEVLHSIKQFVSFECSEQTS